jgi:hypothetical protein
MGGMRLWLAVLAVLLGTSTVMANTGAELDRTDAFEQAYGASFFELSGGPHAPGCLLRGHRRPRRCRAVALRRGPNHAVVPDADSSD